MVREDHVKSVFDRYGIDMYGLSTLDRRVIQFLFTQAKPVKGGGVHYAASEDAVVSAVGVDKARWRTTIRRRLFDRRLMVVPQGQALTPRALEWYGHLRPTE